MTAPLVSTLITFGGGNVGVFALAFNFIFGVDIAEQDGEREKGRRKR